MNILGFWLFLAVVAGASIWASIHRRQSKHETLRLMIEKGDVMDSKLIDDVLHDGRSSMLQVSLDTVLKVIGIVALFLGIGFFSMSLVYGQVDPAARAGLLATACLVVCLAFGFLLASLLVQRSNNNKTIVD